MRVRCRIRPLMFTVSLFALAFLGLNTVLWAQSTNTGTIVGTVTDPSGAVVNDAAVTLTDTSTKTSPGGEICLCRCQSRQL